MPITSGKGRGKSAAHSILSSNYVQLHHQATTATSSNLLKIESVLPTLCRSNPTKSMYRSYSTLSSGYFKRPSPPSTDAKGDLDIRKQINGNGQYALQQQQQQQTPLPNGFWRINRSTKEKEKLPDRINLDRRGLTALPIIEDEPNLRLLSLQHNLINSFSVPDSQKNDEKKGSPITANSTLESVKKNEQQSNKSANAPQSTTGQSQNQCQKLSSKNAQFLGPKLVNRNLHVNGNNISNKYPNGGLQHQQSMQSMSTSSTTTTTSSSSGNTSNNSNTIMKNSFVQKSVLFHAKERYVFKKSNSFINSYSQHLASAKIHLGRLKDANRANITSFSSESLSHQPDNGSEITNTVKASNSNNTNSTATSVISSGQTSGINNTTEGLMIKNDPFHGFNNNLQNLVFIDLYDNQIEKICTLDGLKSLTVLLLGKNRISDITGIVSVKSSLRVLDLHGNKITSISQKICQLQELKSLNLAGNNLKQINSEDFKGLCNLRELNLKRNKIKKINGFDDLRSLERLWLCHNDLQKVEDMSAIAKAINLKEVTIENNPVSLGGDCVSFIVSYLPSLVLLSQMQVTDQVRRAAMAWRKSKETSDANYSHLSQDVCHNIRREEIISNARTNWELLRSQQHVNKASSFIQKAIKNTSQQLQVPISELESDVFSDLSDSLKIDRKVPIRPKINLNHVKRGKKSAKPTKRSSSQDNLPGEIIMNGILPNEELFRLPPILAPFLDENCLTTIDNRPINSSGSSLGPNIDSSSNYFSSDNDEAAMLKKESKTVSPIVDELSINHLNENLDLKLISDSLKEVEKIDNLVENAILAAEETKVPNEPLTILLENNVVQEESNETNELIEELKVDIANEKIENDSQSDKTSNVSANSAKTPSDVGSTIVCEDTITKQKPSSKNSNRKYPNTLVRSQTIKNQTQNGASQTAGALPTPASGNSSKSTAKTNLNDRDREQGGDYLIEICGRYLNVYGAGAIKFIDRQWNCQKANDVHTFKFSYVNFNSIATILSKIKCRFPNAENFVFRETNINSLGQLNAFAEIQGICSLVIDPEGNLVCLKNWRLYAVYRLSHWGIKTINGIDVTGEEIDEAQRAYSGLSDLVLWSLPDSLIEPLLAKLRLDETCTASKMSPKQWLMQIDPALRNVVGKEALQSKKLVSCPDEMVLRQRGKTYFSTMMENTCNAVDKLQKLDTMWSSLLIEMIRNTLLDYSQIDVYIKNLMGGQQ